MSEDHTLFLVVIIKIYAVFITIIYNTNTYTCYYVIVLKMFMNYFIIKFHFINFVIKKCFYTFTFIEYTNNRYMK